MSIERIIKNHEEAEMFEVAGDSALKAGMVDEAQRLYRKYLKGLERGKFVRQFFGQYTGPLSNILSRIAKKEGMANMVIDFCMEQGYSYHAADIALEAGKPEKAIEAYEQARMYLNAARLAKKEGMTDKAQELYEKIIQERIQDGCRERRFERDESNLSLLQAFSQGLYLRTFKNAADIALEAGMPEKAIEISIKYLSSPRLAAHYAKQGFR